MHLIFFNWGDQAQNDLGFMVDQAKWVCKIGYLLSRKMKKIFTLEIQTYFGLFVEKKKREKLSLEIHFTFQIQLLDQFVMDWFRAFFRRKLFRKTKIIFQT